MDEEKFTFLISQGEIIVFLKVYYAQEQAELPPPPLDLTYLLTYLIFVLCLPKNVISIKVSLCLRRWRNLRSRLQPCPGLFHHLALQWPHTPGVLLHLLARTTPRWTHLPPSSAGGVLSCLTVSLLSSQACPAASCCLRRSSPSCRERAANRS